VKIPKHQLDEKRIYLPSNMYIIIDNEMKIKKKPKQKVLDAERGWITIYLIGKKTASNDKHLKNFLPRTSHPSECLQQMHGKAFALSKK
jgi:hypothetical protein